MPRQKSSPARQELAKFKRYRRTVPTEQESAALPITAKPPSDLDQAGKVLWVVVAEMQKSFHESGIAVSITDAQAPALHAYCKTYSRWLMAGKAIKAREAGLKPSERHKAMFVEDGEDVKLRGEYRAEQELQKSMTKMGAAIGLSKSTPLVAVQVNESAKRSGEPGFELLHFNEEAARIRGCAIEGEIVDAADAPETEVREEG